MCIYVTSRSHESTSSHVCQPAYYIYTTCTDQYTRKQQTHTYNALMHAKNSCCMKNQFLGDRIPLVLATVYIRTTFTCIGSKRILYHSTAWPNTICRRRKYRMHAHACMFVPQFEFHSCRYIMRLLFNISLSSRTKLTYSFSVIESQKN